MVFNLFGYELKKGNQSEQVQISPVSPTSDDGSYIVSDTSFGRMGVYDGQNSSAIQQENDLINSYRMVSLIPEVEYAIDEIVNEMVLTGDQESSVSIDLDSVDDIPESVKKKIEEEFDNILNLLEFNKKCYEIVRQWYIDGRLYYNVIIDMKAPQTGIKELRKMDSLKVKKIKELKTSRDAKGIEFVKEVQEYYTYNKFGNQYTPINLTKDSVIYVTSGLLSPSGNKVYSYLHKALKIANILNAVEDSLVIYRLSRSSEKRLFKVDVGQLQKGRAEQYMQKVIERFKTKFSYNPETGEVKGDRKVMSLTEDFYVPVRSDGRGSSIETLAGGQNLGDIQDIEYFINKLYKSLNVPFSRMQVDSGFTMGRASEIKRDEVKFSKFISRLRTQFSILFDEALKQQLHLKKIMDADEFEKIREKIFYDFKSDTYFSELNDLDILRERLSMANEMEPYVGKYFSRESIRKKILDQSEEDIRRIDAEIASEIPDDINSLSNSENEEE